MPKEKRTKLSIILPVPLLEDIDAYCKRGELSRSRSRFVEMAVTYFLQNVAERRKQQNTVAIPFEVRKDTKRGPDTIVIPPLSNPHSIRNELTPGGPTCKNHFDRAHLI